MFTAKQLCFGIVEEYKHLYITSQILIKLTLLIERFQL